MNEQSARVKLAEICKLLYDRNLTVSAGGNMSLRLNEKEFIITPTGRNKGMLRPDEMVLMNIGGKVLSDGKPSIERTFHIAFYKANPDTNSVIHCHPLYCTSLAVKGEKIRSSLTPEGVLLLGDVPLVGYFTPGSKKLADAVAENTSCKAILMARHGAITQGRTIEEAFNRMEELEFQAKLQMLTAGADELPLSEIKKLEKM
ncbi:L-fuculose phosphate aldolase [Candidatus Methanoplasma termitum]|uniref:FucA protein n=1 Tax=Candidatus Methanoplasma termitum TaxID=1577791 RepID=A0A0A7LHJ3_9ARCH|nr:class II aldolase/adducin family protein [Candidatus Methanoplasma termitum]AIZ56986.1 L-fuculose phosphate aldolase [Candidatus Methanoplasma termitum]MCL2334109.1 class II aldolase/adducin family protein [Candidatus Methanoplasma sp.]